MGGIKVWLQADPKRNHRWVIKSHNAFAAPTSVSINHYKSSGITIKASTIGTLNAGGREYVNGISLHPHTMTTTIKIPDEYKYLIKGMKC